MKNQKGTKVYNSLKLGLIMENNDSRLANILEGGGNL
jgi:hypothetical protein